MPVTAVGSLHELTNILERADANRLIIVDFFAVWCNPCRVIAPFFEQLSVEFGNATFLKVNCDEAKDIVIRYRINAMPAFVFFKNRQQVDLVRGADQTALQATIRRHYSAIPANPNSASDEEKRFLEQFVRYTGFKKYYTDEVYKALARSVIPEETVIEKARGPDGNVDEMRLLQNLMDWFKNDFFTWFDRPTCQKCNLKAKSSGLAGTPTKEEREGGAQRVEVFSCDQCNAEMRFPRFNDPARLLQTRTGRCGEWANCFALMLAAVGIEARLVLDTTDHVWNEVYLKGGPNRWIHVDPCENVMDKPLLYTKGWNKQPAYIVAYGHDHVADVTWRYVYDSKMTKERRTEVRQTVFENFLNKLNARQMEGVSESRKEELKVRRTCELLEMISEDTNRQKIGWENLGEGYSGRTTGSEEWRKARGELGSEEKVLGEPIKIQNGTAASGLEYLEFFYDINTDTYSQDPFCGFHAAAFECENLKRVVEKDWGMTYLCRKQGDKPGTISWHVDLESLEKPAKKVLIRVKGVEKFEKGQSMVVVCLGDTCMKIPASGELKIDNPAVGILKITATLSGGEGNLAFQQAQLFRTAIGKEPTRSLTVRIWTE